jgi:cytochrome c553
MMKSLVLMFLLFAGPAFAGTPVSNAAELAASPDTTEAAVAQCEACNADKTQKNPLTEAPDPNKQDRATVRKAVDRFYTNGEAVPNADESGVWH